MTKGSQTLSTKKLRVKTKQNTYRIKQRKLERKPMEKTQNRLESLAKSLVWLFREIPPYDLRVWRHQHTNIKLANIQLYRNLIDKQGKKLVYLVYEGWSYFNPNAPTSSRDLHTFQGDKHIPAISQMLFKRLMKYYDCNKTTR